METDIRKNVRQCVRSSEKVWLNQRVRACLGVRAVRFFLCVCVEMKHQGGRRMDLLSLVLIAASDQTSHYKETYRFCL